jgi:1-phosphofructokinase family hexose kinase
MILTITLNSAIDKVLLLDELTPGQPMRAHGEVISVGGKGLDSSVVLRHLGVETVGLAFAAGKTGKELESYLLAYGIIPDLVWVAGETRVIYVLAESLNKRISHVKLGEIQVGESDLVRFMDAYRARLAGSDWVICSGSMPDSVPVDFYARLARQASEHGVPFLLDCPGEMMLAALPHQPAIAKMNREEFEATFKMKVSSLDELIAQAVEIVRLRRIHILVITCAAQGILAITPEGVCLAVAPIQEVVNVAGAGDAVSSALAWRLSLGDSLQQALCWAAACAAAVVRTPGTADCRWEDVLAIHPQVAIKQNIL